MSNIKDRDMRERALDIEELTALYRIATLGVSHTDVARVVGEVLRLISELVPCERPVVLLHDAETESLVLHTTGEDATPIPLSEPSIARRIFHSGRGEVINDVVADPDSNPVAERLGALQAVGAPLFVGEDRLGVVFGLNSRRGAFTEGDLRSLSLLAERAALTIENARLRATVERQSQELTGLQRLSRLLTSAETMDHAVGESIRIVSDLLDCGKMAILLYDEERDALAAFPPVVGLEDSQVEELVISLATPSLAGTVFRTDTPLMSNDVPDDAWVGEELRRLPDVENLLVVPLSAGPRPIGVLMAMDAPDGRFDESDLRFTSLLGARIGGVIESSRSRERERALVQRLREADRTKSEFVSILAHELKGPMTTILGFSQTLKDQGDALSEQQRAHFLDIVTKETGRLSRLVNDLLDVSRMEAGTVRYDLEPMDLQEVVENLLEVHSSIRSEHHVVTEVPADLPKVLGDRDRVRQVLLNLLTNATRYSPEQTTITISAAVVEEGEERIVRVSVADEGIGIPDEDADRVFSKFAMLPKPGWVKKGTGLGLFISRGIVEAHGGRMWVESEHGRGSVFHFTLHPAE